LKFLKDTQALFNKEDVESDSFPEFVGNFLVNKFPKKDTLHKKAVDFMLSLDFYGLKHKDIKVFQQFVTEEYDTDDLIFYLFVRSCIEKELKIFFLEKAKENLSEDVEDDDIMVPIKRCEKLAKSIFGEETDLLMNFKENIKKLLGTDAADEKRRNLKANAILNMALVNYHYSRGKVKEANEAQEMDSDEEERRRRKKEQKKKEKAKEKQKEKKSPKKKREEEEEIRETKKKVKPKEEYYDDEKGSDNEYNNENDNNNNNENDNDIDNDNVNEEEEEEEKPDTKKTTKLRAQKKPNLKISTNEKIPSKNIAVKTSSGAKPKISSSNLAKNTKSTKLSNTIRVPGSKPGSRPIIKPSNKLATSSSTRMITSGNAANKMTSSRPQRKASQDAKISRTKVSKKAPGAGNTDKKKQTSSVGKRQVPGQQNTQGEQSQEFKKILAKNKIDKVKSENDKTNCLLYIISDYFKMKEIDEYFKDIIDKNPIFQNFSSKILSNIRTPKEFTLKKLNGICKYISAGDKNGFYTFNNIKNKVPKNNFENLKSLYNDLQKQPLQNLNEKDIEIFCKTILEIPELSVQTTKSFLKYCE
jgi:hypothetical protein